MYYIVKKENVSFDYRNSTLKKTQFTKHHSPGLWTKYFIVSPVITILLICAFSFVSYLVNKCPSIFRGFLKRPRVWLWSVYMSEFYWLPAFTLYCSTCFTDAEDAAPGFSESTESRDVMASERQPWVIVTGHCFPADAQYG